MKKILLIICSFFFLGTYTSNAQLWKKLKKKAQEKIQKAEDKLVNGIDKTIDKTVNGKTNKTEKKKAEEKIVTNNEKDFGDATISHSHTYNKIKIGHLTQTNVNKQGNKFTVSGHWWSSGVDVYDGYDVTIKNTTKEELMNGKTFQIPDEASFYIGYDPLLGDRENRKDKWKGSVKNNIESGTIKVQYVEGLSVQISFNVNGTLQKYVDDGGNGYYDEKPITINGTLTTEDPSFQITKETKTTTNNSSSSNDVSDEELEKLYESTSPTVDIPSTFSFNKKITLEVTTDDGDNQEINILLGKYPDIYGINVAVKEMQGQGNMLMVMTPKSSVAFMDVAGMKMKKATSLDQLGDQFETQENLPEDGDFEYQKTGNTKTILGYTCYEYKVDYDYTNSKGSATFWVSEEFPIQNKELPMLGMQLNNTNFSGFVLEMNGEHEGKKSTIKVTNVSDTNLSINSNEYRNMGF
jgi:hypothetical protein